MNIETKFNLNQKVYVIVIGIKTVFVKCKKCNGSGYLELKAGGSIMCNECCGRGGFHENSKQKWSIVHCSKIGKIDVELYSKKHKRKNEIKYMIEATGIGSGTLWYERDVFATEEEAQTECDKRNKKRSKK